MKNCIGWLLLCFWLCLAGLVAWGASDFIFNYVEENNNDRYDDKPCVLARVAHGDDGDIASLASGSIAGQEQREARAAKTQSDTTEEMPRVLTATQIRQLWGVEGSIRELEEEGGLVTIKYSRRNVAKIREIQRLLGVEIDGRVGKATLDAMILKLGGKIPAKPAKAAKVTLRKLPTAREVRSNRSIYGKAGLVPMAIVTLPYPMRYGSKTIHQIGVHYLIADRVELALQRTLNHYGIARIRELNLDIYNGCFNYRKVRNGSLQSLHSWAVALDFDAANNGLGVPTSRAAFARPEYKGWRDAWESVGAVFYGKQRGHDWMQIQFVR